jgi:magnesium transporter
MSKQKREIIIELLDPELRSNLTKIYSYDNDEIGSRMSTDFIKIDKNAPVKEAMRSMTEQVRELDTDNISILYVTDENGQYYGAIKIQDLFVARAGSSLEDIISINFPFVYGNELIADSMEDLKDYAEDSIPVLRRDNTLEGIITRQNLLELLDQELSEDYAKLGGLTSQEDLEESLFHSLQKRTPWLLLLLFLSLGVSTVVSMFEGVVAKLSVAVVFQSLVLDMAGNVGTQSLAVSIRVLADPDLTIKERMFLIFKETRTGFANGLVIGSGSALVLGIFIHYAFGYSWINAYAIALCVGLSMLVSMVISSLSGTAIPALFQRLGIDPAAASGPLITTLNDLIGVTTYYSLVWVLLIQMLKL